MKRLILFIPALLAACAAVASAMPPETLTLQDLVNHPERWPATVTMQKDLKFRSGAVIHQGDKAHVEMFDGTRVGLTAGASRFAVPPEDCGLLDAANQAWTALTPAQRAVDPGSLAADPSVWPAKVNLSAAVKCEFGALPANTEVDLLTVAADSVSIIWPHSKNKVAVEFASTDVIDRARALAAVDPGKRPSRIVETLTPLLVDADGKPYHEDHLADKKIFAFYFGAGWCPPCRAFSPDFMKFAATALPAHPELEIVFMSNDRDLSGMTDYMKEEKMPFPAVQLKDINQSAFLVSYAAEMIPHLIVVDRFGKVLASSDANGNRIDPKDTVAALDKLLKTPAP